MKTISSKLVYDCGLFQVTEDVARDTDGFEIRRSIVRHPGSAVIFPEDERRRILLVRQFRLPAGGKLWELPAGKIDEGETALQAAKRELAEETGYKGRKWERLVAFHPSPGLLAEKMTIFRARELTAGTPTPTESERIETAWYSRAEVGRMIAAGKISDGKTIIGYFLSK